ncbi:hypothetical protein DSO57_1028554 [Entomophthora muscae]|uniref:Uncharacterized protein n=1 Tax=Entomophthora muscae TaxID=34485 RepID=A0ACC2UC76_9FUNG|nr:hypothetical protein DSO57_1028554 [Entomophthora muscae]
MIYTIYEDSDILEKQYPEQLQPQATDQGSTTAMDPVYTQLNLSYKEDELYIFSGAALGLFFNNQYEVIQDQAQPEPVSCVETQATVPSPPQFNYHTEIQTINIKLNLIWCHHGKCASQKIDKECLLGKLQI